MPDERVEYLIAKGWTREDAVTSIRKFDAGGGIPGLMEALRQRFGNDAVRAAHTLLRRL